MITSIALTGKYNIGVNSNNKIKVDDKVLSLDSEIPFVRYRFNEYDDSSIEYISAMKAKFVKQTHLAEMQLVAGIGQIVDKLNPLLVAKYIYIDLTDETVSAGKLDDATKQLIESEQIFQKLSLGVIDRVMFRDKSSTLDLVAFNKIVANLIAPYKSLPNVNKDNIGVCSSPLSFGDMCCLTAVRARDLMAKYSASADVALPSANHQNMNTCGCIRYVVVSSDTEAPSEATLIKHTKKGNTAEQDAAGASGETKDSKPKESKPKKKQIRMMIGQFR